MELISKADAVQVIWESVTRESATKKIDELPTIEERKVGEWIHDVHYGLKLPEHRCSICGEWEYSDTESKFCPNCGARMKGE